MRRTAGYTWTDYKNKCTNCKKELKITPILDKLLEYKRSRIQHVNRMPRNRLPRVMKHYCPTGRRKHGRPLKRLLDTWDRNGSTSGPTPWKIYDDDDDDDDKDKFDTCSCVLKDIRNNTQQGRIKYGKSVLVLSWIILHRLRCTVLRWKHLMLLRIINFLLPGPHLWSKTERRWGLRHDSIKTRHQ